MIFILGPTASGKSDLALHLAKSLPNPILISADSRQSYVGMDVGTAKPSPDELESVPHLNINLLSPKEKDSASKFRERVLEWKKRYASHSLIVVGGSTLYLNALLFKPNDIPASDPNILSSLSLTLQKEGIEYLYERLKQVDSLYATKMDGFNTQRILRALCVFEMTGKPFSSFHTHSDNSIPDLPEAKVFGLSLSRDRLHQRINDRVDRMFELGLSKEVQRLLNAGMFFDDPGMQTVGYREFKPFFEGNCSLDDVKTSIKTSTRRYARRQLTWFRKWNFIQWLPTDSLSKDEQKNYILEHIQPFPLKKS